jgi:hypothetical protein
MVKLVLFHRLCHFGLQGFCAEEVDFGQVIAFNRTV